MTFASDLRNVFRKDNGLMKLIIINVIVFILVNITVALGRLSGIGGESVTRWLALPSDLSQFLTHCWTVITYMFLHLDLSHIFFNLLWLYWLGKIFTEYMGSKRLISVYLLGGISGGLLFMGVFNLVPTWGTAHYLLGASAGVMAVVVATAAFVPNYVVVLFLLGPVRLKYIALVSFLLTSIIDLTQNTGGKVAHIGGALFGLLYGLQYKNGKDILRGFYRFLDKLASLFSFKSRPSLTVSYKKKISDEEYNLNKKQKQKRIDEILDKISRSGYESLSKDEKQLLFKISNDKN